MKCPECNNSLYDYFEPETGFTQSICWKCGHYEDNSPAFQLLPKSFTNLLRDNPIYFMKKFAHQPTGNTNNNSREDNSTILRVLFD
jgi:hypothetical protein